MFLRRLKKALRQEPVLTTAVSDMEAIGADYPGSVDAGDETRTARYTGRWFAVAFGLSFAGNLLQAGYQMVSSADVELRPLFIQTEPKADQVIQVLPLKVDGAPALHLAEYGWVKEFVQRRHTVLDDKKAMTANIAWLKVRMGDGPWTDYEGERSQIKEAIESNVTRTVTISNATSQSENFYLVDFSYVDTQKDKNSLEPKEIGRGFYRASVRFSYKKKDIRRGDVEANADATNPFGFTVLFYSVAPITGPGSQQRQGG